MASRRVNDQKVFEGPSTRRPPATTPEARENQLIAKAVSLAERQLDDGTASAQIISHYLKLGSSREKLEQERLSKENSLLDAKREAIEAAQNIQELYKSALDAMRSYSGMEPEAITEDFDD